MRTPGIAIYQPCISYRSAGAFRAMSATTGSSDPAGKGAAFQEAIQIPHQPGVRAQRAAHKPPVEVIQLTSNRHRADTARENAAGAFQRCYGRNWGRKPLRRDATALLRGCLNVVRGCYDSRAPNSDR